MRSLYAWARALSSSTLRPPVRARFFPFASPFARHACHGLLFAAYARADMKMPFQPAGAARAKSWAWARPCRPMPLCIKLSVQCDPRKAARGTVFSTGIHRKQYLRAMAALLFEIKFYATSISCSCAAGAAKIEPHAEPAGRAFIHRARPARPMNRILC